MSDDGVRGMGRRFSKVAVLACTVGEMVAARCVGPPRHDLVWTRRRTIEPDRPSIVSDRPPDLTSAAWTFSPKCSIAFASAGRCCSTSSSAIPGAWRCQQRPYALFHYLSRGSATLALEQGRELRHDRGRLCRRHTRRAPCDLFGSPDEAVFGHGPRSTVRAVLASFVTAAARSRSRR